MVVLAGLFVVAFDEDAVLERRAGADERDEVWCIDGTPPGLGGLDELERHRDPSRPRAGSLGDALTQPYGRERRLDRVGGAQVDPVLGRVVVERQEHVEVVGDLRDRLGPLRAVVGGERLGSFLGVVLESVSARDRLLNAVASSCQSLVSRVMVAGDRPWLVPRNSLNAGPKSPLDRPCRYSSGNTSATRGDFLDQAGRITDENRLRCPLASSVRLSLTRGARTGIAPAAVVTSRGSWNPFRTTSRCPFSSSSPANASM